MDQPVGPILWWEASVGGGLSVTLVNEFTCLEEQRALRHALVVKNRLSQASHNATAGASVFIPRRDIESLSRGSQCGQA